MCVLAKEELKCVSYKLLVHLIEEGLKVLRTEKYNLTTTRRLISANDWPNENDIVYGTGLERGRQKVKLILWNNVRHRIRWLFITTYVSTNYVNATLFCFSFGREGDTPQVESWTKKLLTVVNKRTTAERIKCYTDDWLQIFSIYLLQLHIEHCQWECFKKNPYISFNIRHY